MSFDKLVEEKIKEAQQRGELDNLPGKGKPVNLSAYFETPEDVRLAQSVLKNAGFTSHEVDLLNEIAGLKQALAFLPWCASATILERNDDVVTARVAVEVRGVRLQFVTRNRKRRPEWMGLALDDGPFARFGGEWNLKPLGADGCRIDFALDYDFERALLRSVASAVFDRITNTLVDAFVARADALGAAIPAVAPVAPPPLVPVIAPPSRLSNDQGDPR